MAQATYAPQAAYAIPLQTPTEQAVDSNVEFFIQQHGLDERVTKALRELSPDLQQQLISQDMGSVRNPSAVVWSRIRNLGNAQSAAAQLGSATQPSYVVPAVTLGNSGVYGYQ